MYFLTLFTNLHSHILIAMFYNVDSPVIIFFYIRIQDDLTKDSLFMS